MQGWHTENPARGIYPKNPGGIFGINSPGIKGIFGIFGINGQIAKKNIVLPLLTDFLVKKQDIQKAL